MRMFTVLGILFYAVVLSLIGVGLIVFSLDIVSPSDISTLLFIGKETVSNRWVVGLSGVLFILISFSFAQLILGRMHSEKTIAFKTQGGGVVTIALSAIEDLIKHSMTFLPEIKDLRPDVIASSKGLIVTLRVVLKTETDIQEFTSKLQNITRSKIQDVLGLDEQIVIKIHISKIIMHDERETGKRPGRKDESAIPPYGSFGRV
jgi:uncharacterized alkaline shock family protein YloU